jgi:hypothetical protein
MILKPFAVSLFAIRANMLSLLQFFRGKKFRSLCFLLIYSFVDIAFRRNVFRLTAVSLKILSLNFFSLFTVRSKIFAGLPRFLSKHNIHKWTVQLAKTDR